MNELDDLVHDMNNAATVWAADGHEQQAEQVTRWGQRIERYRADHPDLDDEEEEEEEEDEDDDDEDDVVDEDEE